MLGFTVMISALGGCARTASTRFYTLSAIPADEPAVTRRQSLDGMSIGIGPVNLPDYLDRPQIVIRTSANELRLAELDKWAGSLKYAVPRIIADNLSTLLGTDQVYTFPWKSALAVRYQVIIDIARFDAQMGSHADLEAQWTVFENDGRTPVATQKTKIRKPVTATGFPAVVQAESEVLSELSREIGETLLGISRP